MKSKTYKLRISSVDLKEYFNTDDGFVSSEDDGNIYVLECYNTWEKGETNWYTLIWKINREMSDYHPSLDSKPKFNKLCEKWHCVNKSIRCNSPYDISIMSNVIEEEEEEESNEEEEEESNEEEEEEEEKPKPVKRKLRNPIHNPTH